MSGIVCVLLATALQDDAQVARLLQELVSERVEAREKADEELRALGPRIRPKLAHALKDASDAELRARIEAILRSFVARRITEGFHPCPSPDGKRLAWMRWAEDPDRQDMRGNKVLRPDVWIHDAGKERRIAEDDWLIGWAGADRLMLRTAGCVGMDGEKAKGAAALPDEFHVKNVRWAPGGERLVYLPNVQVYGMNPGLKPTIPVSGTLHVLDAAGKVRSLDLQHAVNTDAPGFLSWSPDGRRLAFHLLFFRKGNLPVRRIGVADIEGGKIAYVADGAYVHQNWGLNRSEEFFSAPDAWNASGDRFVFVTGQGGGEGEVYVARADGSETVRLTDDGLCKWAATLDPYGRRVAFRAARWGGEDGTLRDECVKVLNLYTGEEECIRPRADGSGTTVAWSADGRRLVYDWDGEVFEAQPLPAEPPAKDAKPRDRGAGSFKAEVLKALASDKPAIVYWAAARAGELRKDDELVAGLRTALKKNVRTEAGFELLRAVVALDAREAAPEVLAAFDATGRTRCLAMHTAGRWRIDGAEAKLRAILKEEPGTYAAACAAGALLSMGRTEVWTTLKDLAAAPPPVRAHVIAVLREVRDPQSIDLLIGLVTDKERLYTDYTGDVQVGDQAEFALATLTGETFARDGARWKAWWEKQARALPESATPNKAVQRLEREREERAAKRK